MPITGRTPEECFRAFQAHFGALVAATVSRRHPLIRNRLAPHRMALGLRESAPRAVPIDTRFGRLFVALSQLLVAVKDEEEPKRYRLRTLQYWYRLQAAPELTAPALIRWEYDAATPRDAFCRHHAQMPAVLRVGDGELDLDKVHLATGWVTIEEVLRFLIIELGVRPPCGDEWPLVLAKSEEAFFEQFTGKRQKPPLG